MMPPIALSVGSRLALFADGTTNETAAVARKAYEGSHSKPRFRQRLSTTIRAATDLILSRLGKLSSKGATKEPSWG